MIVKKINQKITQINSIQSQIQDENGNVNDFGISAGQKLECTYYRYTERDKFDQSTCGAQSFEELNAALENIGIGLAHRLEGRSLIGQRAATLHTHTGSIRGSFVSFS